MDNMKGPKVNLAICNHCYEYIASKGDLPLQIYLDACVYHQTEGVAAPHAILADINPNHIDYVLKQLENEKFILSHETSQGLFVLPIKRGSYKTVPLYCGNRSLGCSKVFLEHNFND